MKRNANLILHHIIWRGLYFFSVLILNILIARFFAAEKSGQIFFIVNNLALVLLLVSISLESGSAYYIASGNVDPALMARFCLVWSAGASFIALSGWWVAQHLTHSTSLTEPGFIPASFLFISGVLLTTYFTALLYAEHQFGWPNKILSAVNLFLIILLALGKNNPDLRSHFILIYFSCFFIQGILLMIIFFIRYKRPEHRIFPEKSVLFKVLHYSFTALFANLIYFLVNRIDYWFVQYYCSGKELGNYIQASKLGQMLLILPAILGSTIFPILSSQKNQGSHFPLPVVLRLLFWVNGFICIVILCFGYYLFPFIFGHSYNQMYLLFVLLIPGILSFTMNYPLAAWFSASNRIGINIKGAGLALIVICAGDFLILPQAGVLSAPAISSAGYFCYYCYTLYLYRKENPVSWNELLLIRKSDIQLIRISIGNKLKDPISEPPFVTISAT